MNVPRGLVAWWHRTERPLPPVDVEHGPAVPGWVFRVALLVAVPGLILLAAARTSLPGAVPIVLAAVFTAWVALRPEPDPVYIAVLVTGMVLLGSDRAPFDPAAVWLAPLAYATTRLAWWAEHTGLRVRVELAALARTGRRDAAVLLGTVALGLVTWAASGRAVAAVLAVGVAALAGLAWLVLRREDGQES